MSPGARSSGGHDIFGQRFDAAASPAAGEFQVNSYTTGGQGGASLGRDAGGDFVVVWSSFGGFGSDSDYSIQMRRFAMDGTPAGPETQVNTYTTDTQRLPEVAVLPSGEFVVVWSSLGAAVDSDAWSVQARRFDSAGLPRGDPFQVNTYTTGGQLWPDVAYQPDGHFVVVWSSAGSFGTDDDEASIQMRRFDVAGNPLGAEVQVNTQIEDSQQVPAVTSLADGRFVVAFAQGPPGNPSQAGIGLRVFQADGTPDGDERLVSNFGALQIGNLASAPLNGRSGSIRAASTANLAIKEVAGHSFRTLCTGQEMSSLSPRQSLTTALHLDVSPLSKPSAKIETGAVPG